MAEESIVSLVTPEENELDGKNITKISAGISGSVSNGHNAHIHHHRASIGSYHAGESPTRNSSDKSDSANSGQNAVPHYLRASTGSCHDLCKYGRKHSFEEKARKPLRRRIAKPLPSELYPVQIMVAGEKKKEKVVNDKPMSDTKNQSPDTKSLDKEKTVEPEPLTDTKNHSPDLPSSSTKRHSRKPKTSLDKEMVGKYKLSTGTKNHSPDLPSTGTKSSLQKPKMSSDAKMYTPRKISSGKKTILPKYNPSTKKFPSPDDPPEIVKSVFFPSKKVEDPVKHGSSTDNKMSRAGKRTTYLAKQPSPMKSKPIKLKPSSSSDNSDGTQGKGRRRNGNAETGRNMTSSKASAKKVPAPIAAAIPTKLSVTKTAFSNSGRAGNSKLASRLNDQNRMRRVKTKTSNNQKISEKTLDAIKTETEKDVFDSIANDHAISSLPYPPSTEPLSDGKISSFSSHEEDNGETEYSGGKTDKSISDNNESLKIDKVPPVKENHKKYLRKSRAVVSDDKYCSPVKLKFRIGKVVDLQSDNNGPRRLRFRRARVVGPEDGKGDLKRKTFKKAGVNGDATRAELSSEKVVLKHQDVQGKKDAQGLFNNVIEETASKLVESRKSKVKALVGAFETVISLQETKPSLQAAG